MATSTPCESSTYDIMIAGGGTAGCVLASRLSEIPALRILLLEAGGNHNDDPRVKIPALFVQAYHDPNLDWDYRVVLQPGLDGRRPIIARGKGLGGSSLINLLGLVYPSKSGFDAWAEIGNPGWDWDSMVPYLGKFSTSHTPSQQVVKNLQLQYIDDKMQGTNGPIQACYQNEDQTIIDRAWIETFENLGYSVKADTLSGRSLGGYQVTSSIDPQTRERSHASVAYLDKAKQRSNLEVVTGVLVDKLVFTHGDSLRASGVQFLHDGNMHLVTASREVILCGGSIGSPAILERSGIGQRKRLPELGIDVAVENESVGENLQDHFLCGVSFELKDGFETIDSFRDAAYVQEAMRNYQESRTGPLTGTTASFAYMPLLEDKETSSNDAFRDIMKEYFDTPNESGKYPSQNLQESFTRKVLEDPMEASANFCLVKGQTHLERDDDWKYAFGPVEEGSYVTPLTALAHPLSRGNTHITSSDPHAAPRIDPAYYSHPLDVELMARQVQLFERITTTEPLASMIKPGGRRIPEWAKFDSVEETKKLLKASCFSNQHVCGTAAMLPRDKGGVVDTRLNVYGVAGLRVIDASIFPIIPRCNIQSCVYAVAEKGAVLIKEDLGYA